MKRRKVDKNEILNIGLKVVWEKGFNGVSVKEIVNEADILIGSFYNYFKSKEEFVLNLLDWYWIGWEKILQCSLQNKTLNSKERFCKLFDDSLERYAAKKYKQGCFAGMLAHELSDTNEKFAIKTEILFKQATSYYVEAIEQGKKEGLIDKNRDSQELAEFIFNAFEGALLRMKSAKEKRPLLLCKEMTLKFLFE